MKNLDKKIENIDNLFLKAHKIAGKVYHNVITQGRKPGAADHPAGAGVMVTICRRWQNVAVYSHLGLFDALFLFL